MLSTLLARAVVLDNDIYPLLHVLSRNKTIHETFKILLGCPSVGNKKGASVWAPTQWIMVTCVPDTDGILSGIYASTFWYIGTQMYKL